MARGRRVICGTKTVGFLRTDGSSGEASLWKTGGLPMCWRMSRARRRILDGALVIPGLVDIHVHGCAGADFSDGDYAGLVRMARYLARRGVTSFAPASMTLPYDALDKAFHAAARLHREGLADGARLMGIQMEGPFLSREKRGSQNPAYLRLPDWDRFLRLYDAAEGLLRIVDVAPELPGAVEFTRRASEKCRVSVAHTAAGYDQAAAVFDAGATHLTHLFNAMSGIHHRHPGPIGAASERENVTAELICDGIHVHPSAVRMAFRLFPGRICLISDALRCCGMADGSYSLGGQEYPSVRRGGPADRRRHCRKRRRPVSVHASGRILRHSSGAGRLGGHGSACPGDRPGKRNRRHSRRAGGGFCDLRR